MRRALPIPLLVVIVACGGSSSPSSPSSPAAAGPPAAQTWVLSGTVVDTVSGAPVAGASVAFAGRGMVTTDGQGRWEINGTGSAGSRQAVTVSADGYLARETGVRWDAAGRSNVTLDIVADRPPFSLSFYRQLVRNGFDDPGVLQNVARWTSNPNFYVNAVNPRSSQPLETFETNLVVQAIRQAVPQLTGGRFSAGEVEVGVGARPARTNYIAVNFVYEPKADYCGQAYVAANPGEITINYDRCAYTCGSLKVTPAAVAHEVGHALGFWHADADGIMNPYLSVRCGSVQFSDEEMLHARIAYSRPPGNRDIDRDPASFSTIQAGRAPLVICGTRIRADQSY